MPIAEALWMDLQMRSTKNPVLHRRQRITRRDAMVSGRARSPGRVSFPRQRGN